MPSQVLVVLECGPEEAFSLVKEAMALFIQTHEDLVPSGPIWVLGMKDEKEEL